MPTRAPHGPAAAEHGGRPAAFAAAAGPGSCLGRTCLHWRSDGELVDDDRDLVMQRLREVDPQLENGLGA